MGLANQTSPSESLDNLSVKIDSITSTVGTLRDQFKLVRRSKEPCSQIILIKSTSVPWRSCKLCSCKLEFDFHEFLCIPVNDIDECNINYLTYCHWFLILLKSIPCFSPLICVINILVDERLPRNDWFSRHWVHSNKSPSKSW